MADEAEGPRAEGCGAVNVSVSEIGHVRGGRDRVEDDQWGQVEAVIELDPGRFGPEALEGLDEFSHVEVIFLFDRVDENAVHTGARHPRGMGDWPCVGIFAQRGKDRPNRLGLTTCEVIGIKGLSVSVRGLDAVNGTPVLDLKPVMSGFRPRGELREPQWARDIMKDYW